MVAQTPAGILPLDLSSNQFLHFEEQFESFPAYVADHSLKNQFPHKSRGAGAPLDLSICPGKCVRRKIRISRFRRFKLIDGHFSRVFRTVATSPCPCYFCRPLINSVGRLSINVRDKHCGVCVEALLHDERHGCSRRAFSIRAICPWCRICHRVHPFPRTVKPRNKKNYSYLTAEREGERERGDNPRRSRRFLARAEKNSDVGTRDRLRMRDRTLIHGRSRAIYESINPLPADFLTDVREQDGRNGASV